MKHKSYVRKPVEGQAIKRFQEQLMNAFKEFERSMISEKIKRGLRKRKQKIFSLH